MFDDEDDEDGLLEDEPEAEEAGEEQPATERLDWPGAEPKQAAFLTAFVIAGGRICAAARAARISRTLHYRWLKAAANYKELFDQAREQAGDVLEDEAIRRAKEGVRKPVFYRGRKCGYVLEYPEGTLQFLLRGAKPDKYRDNHHIEATISHTGITSLTDAELERIARGSGGGTPSPENQQEQDPDVLPG